MSLKNFSCTPGAASPVTTAFGNSKEIAVTTIVITNSHASADLTGVSVQHFIAGVGKSYIMPSRTITAGNAVYLDIKLFMPPNATADQLKVTWAGSGTINVFVSYDES
jgi:hypothetical protein